MSQLARVGDKNQTGGQILKGSSTVFANGKPVGLHPSDISPHLPKNKKHKKAKTTSGSSSVFVEGKPVLKVGSGNDCGHSIIQGSSDISVS